MPRSRQREEPTRRSTNACHRCKSKKIKCYFNAASPQGTCVPCLKSESSCVFDVTPDGIPRGAEYVAALESRVASLEEQLRNATEAAVLSRDTVSLHSDASVRGSSIVVPPAPDGLAMASVYEKALPILSPALLNDSNHNHNPSPSNLSQLATEDQQQPSPQHKILEPASDGITIFNFLYHPSIYPRQTHGSLLELPPPQVADNLLDTAYVYTQARYCIADWVRVRRWHQRRDTICFATAADDLDSQTGAYFLWMMYAIGSQVVPHAEQSWEKYYHRACSYLPVVLSQQNLTSVSALLTLTQYFYRATGGPSMWHLIGALMRLCIELGLHQRTPAYFSEDSDPYQVEIRKRFFWCAYCFDKSVSILSKRPFAIHDSSINVPYPVDIDVLCEDHDAIRDEQAMQAAGRPSPREGRITTITAALHHLQIYRLQSRIITRFTGLHVLPWTSDEILSFMTELDAWRERTSRQLHSPGFPQQSWESVQAVYYLAGLLLMRTIFTQPNIDETLLQRCAMLSADACENEKTVCFNPHTHNSPIRIYNCFRCGLTLLQCLSIQPTVLPARRALRAISSCSSALAVYTGTLAVARPYLQLFEKLSDFFLGFDEEKDKSATKEELGVLLNQVTSCDPSKIPQLLGDLSMGRTKPAADSALSGHTVVQGYDAQNWTDPMANPGMDLVMPFDLLDDFIRPDTFHQDMLSFWASPNNP